MIWSEISSVWTPLSVSVAVGSGLALGFVLLGRFAADPTYASGKSSPLESAILAIVLTAAIGLVFYGGQIATSWVGGDTGWVRVMSRYGIWLAYSIGIGVGLWLRLHHHLARRRSDAHARAVSELEADE